jgi:hypothetical protein
VTRDDTIGRSDTRRDSVGAAGTLLWGPLSVHLVIPVPTERTMPNRSLPDVQLLVEDKLQSLVFISRY